MINSLSKVATADDDQFAEPATDDELAVVAKCEITGA
jgi:hypothetical protein